MKHSAAIITDLDNTIYNWIDFYAPSFRAMVHVLAKQTNVSESRITQEFRDVFFRFGSTEYPFAIQNLNLCSTLTSERVRRLVYLGQMAFGRSRRKHLRAYPGVLETLQWALKNRIAVVAVTNAPLYLAWRRIERLGLGRFFTGIVAGEDFPIPGDDVYAREYQRKLESRPKNLELYLHSSKRKPDPAIYNEIFTIINVPKERIWVIGDSVPKDVIPAVAVGAKGVWARYGTIYREDNYKTILSITHWSEEQITTTYSRPSAEPMAVVDSFSDLQLLVETDQLSLLI